MKNTDLNNNDELKNILSKATAPNLSADFTNTIMKKVITADAKSVLLIKYIKLSWIFIFIAFVFSIKTVLQLSYFELEFAEAANSIIPGLSEIFFLFLISILSGLFLYQLNNLVSCRFFLLNNNNITVTET